MAKLVDAHDSGSCGRPWGFDSPYRQYLRGYLMKKFVCMLGIMSISALSCMAAENAFMNKAAKSWVNASLDEAINKLGYPTKQENIAGKQLYYWIYRESVRTEFFDDEVTTAPQECVLIMETDSESKIVNGQASGTICPMFYMVGKKYVNPNNDPWLQEKIQKHEQKAKEKESK